MRWCIVLLIAGHVAAQSPATRLNPAIERIVAQISEDRIAQNLKRLEAFETRYILSDQDSPTRGIGAAKRWLADEFKSYSPRLEVSFHNFKVKEGTRRGQVFRDVDLSNVVAMLPGKVTPNRYVLVTAHYDTVSLRRKPVFTEQERLDDWVKRGMTPAEARRYTELAPIEDLVGETDAQATAAATSPGVTDDGSGTAAVLELARVMSQYEFDKTLVFVCFAAEEVGLEGSKAYAAMAKARGMELEALLNNDIIGSEIAGNGRSSGSTLRAFAAGPEDSPSRALLRYTKLIAERYVPSMSVQMIFRGDRFSRGGDHTSFSTQGFAAVRLTTPNENYANQHSGTDTFTNTSVPYISRVARMNAAVLASLALAPAPPEVNYTFPSSDRKGDRDPLLSRGKSGYDAALRWIPSDAPDLAGYAVMLRATTAPDWEREIWVGKVERFTLADVSIDDVVIGLKAVDTDGNQSIVATYQEPVRLLLLAPATVPK